MKKASKLGAFGAVYGVAAVLFGSHAGGGFSTGNQEYQFYVRFGWVGPIFAVLAMVILTVALREAIVMYNNNDCKNYKDLFKVLYSPYPKLEIIFEIYYYFIVIVAVGVVVAASSAVLQSLGLSKTIGIMLVGVILLLLTIYGAKLVASAAGIMSIAILICCFYIFISGIGAKTTEIATIWTQRQFWGEKGFFEPLSLVFVYAGFQSVVIPAITASSRELLSNRRQATGAMFLSFIMNAVALGLAVIMILGWASDIVAASSTNLPTLYVAQHLNNEVILIAYQVSLFLCLMSTGVTCIFGMVKRFENASKLMWMKKIRQRRIFIAVLVMVAGMALGSAGLTNVVKYGYGSCGYLGIFAIIIPLLTVGVYKNRKFKKEHPDYKWYAQRVIDGEEQAE